MQKTVCLQILAILAVLSWNLADAKAFEADNEVLTIEKRDEDGNDQKAEVKEKEVVMKRDPENQEEEEAVVEERDPENQEEEEDMEKRDPENQEEEEDMEKRDPENQEEEEAVVEERNPESHEEEEDMEKRDPENQEEKENEEKREDTDVSESAEAAEAAEVEDLEARTVVPRFTLVDYRGRTINGQQEGLLLFNGGTVCDDGFTTNSANAICRTMGYTSQSHFRHGLIYSTFQSRKRIGLDDVLCSSGHWSSCRSTTHHNCNHREDILLTCQGTGFRLINRAGHSITGRTEGLLTFQHGTVCDDYFSMNSAHAICRLMGFASGVRYRHGLRYGSMQSRRRITMDDVRCRGSYWNYCSHRSAHNCGHHEDILLTCQPGTATHPHGFSIVDWAGARTPRGVEGLLLYNGGTVCDDHFNMNAAHAICKLMGSRSASRYRHGNAYVSQNRKQIRMDDVICRGSRWSLCRFSTRHNCGHGEDIMLKCSAARGE